MTEQEFKMMIRNYKKEIKKLDKQVAESNKRFDYHFNRILEAL